MVYEEILTAEIKKDSFNIYDFSFLIVAIVLIILGMYIYLQNNKIIKNSAEGVGSLEKIPDVNKYLLMFNTSDGKEVMTYSLYNDILHFFHKEDNIKILYNKEKPEEAIVNSFISLYGVSFFTILIGIILIIVFLNKTRKVIRSRTKKIIKV